MCVIKAFHLPKAVHFEVDQCDTALRPHASLMKTPRQQRKEKGPTGWRGNWEMSERTWEAWNTAHSNGALTSICDTDDDVARLSWVGVGRQSFTY